ncbi:MAG: peptide chain release factor 2 [Bacteroidales bacterium]|nr:peptide chain release factor 2 [Bacteroidales bacterium]
MITKENHKENIERLDALRGYLDLDRKQMEIEEEELKTQDPNFWNNPKKAELLLKKIKDKKRWINSWNTANESNEELEILFEFFDIGEIEESEIEQKYIEVINKIEDLELLNMLGAESDKLNAMLQINPGAGGTESQDWAQMLMRMYIRYGERKGYKVNVIEEQDGETAGIKSATIEFIGDNAFGFLKAENGVHRLVRISPFDSASRRHTSFASVYVYPIVDDSIEIIINPADLDWDTFRAGGPGGQHVNKTESAVRLRHEPSGFVVECQETRSQHKNREKAIKMLKSKLYENELRKKQEESQQVEDGKMKIEWGSQIRSYVMHPYKQVKDARTKYETSNVQAVLDGDIDNFIKAFLMQ